jgi:SET domain-containing protein
VRYIPKKGYRGVFACEFMPKGAIIGVNGGRVIDNIDGIPNQTKYGVLIDAGIYLMPSNYNFMENSWFMNHSCGPNVEGIGGRLSIARQNIMIGDEMTVDYAPLVAGEKNWSMVCNCGVPSCRQLVTGDDWKDPTIAKKLWRSFSPHIQRMLIQLDILQI